MPIIIYKSVKKECDKSEINKNEAKSVLETFMGLFVFNFRGKKNKPNIRNHNTFLYIQVLIISVPFFQAAKKKKKITL